MNELEVGTYVLNRAQVVHVIEMSRGKKFLSYDGQRPASHIEAVEACTDGWHVTFFLGSQKRTGVLTKQEAA